MPKDVVVFGEIVLAGEILQVHSGHERLMEAYKHGFKKAIVPIANMPKAGIDGMQIYGVKKLSEAIDAFDEL